MTKAAIEPTAQRGEGLGLPLQDLLRLVPSGEGAWESDQIQLNHNDRAYGGQTAGQAMAAAICTAPPDRLPSMLQLQFLAGARKGPPLIYRVSPLQDGRNFTARRVSAEQSGRPIADAHVSFALVDRRTRAPRYQRAERPLEADPQSCLGLGDMPREWAKTLSCVSGYSLDVNPYIDLRVPDAQRQLFNPYGAHRVEFWLRVTSPFPDSPFGRATAFAYASDWWMNYSSAAAHLGGAEPLKIYNASLNHSIWWHDEIDPGRWMYCISEAVCTGLGRGLTTARFFDASMVLRASTAQESLMRPLDEHLS